LRQLAYLARSSGWNGQIKKKDSMSCIECGLWKANSTLSRFEGSQLALPECRNRQRTNFRR
jgi:hypothetical protein